MFSYPQKLHFENLFYIRREQGQDICVRKITTTTTATFSITALWGLTGSESGREGRGITLSYTASCIHTDIWCIVLSQHHYFVTDAATTNDDDSSDNAPTGESFAFRNPRTPHHLSWSPPRSSPGGPVLHHLKGKEEEVLTLIYNFQRHIIFSIS